MREIAEDIVETSIEQHAATLRLIADWHDQFVENLIPDTDPLIIKNERGNPVIRGVQITIAAHLRDVWGAGMDRTVKTLAEVALNQSTSERVSRSAFSRPKLPKRS